MGELFERVVPEAPLDWTGERLTTRATGEVEIEHLHRYFLAREMCRGCDVLDIAAGEGYGAMLLAQVAKSVIGVELSAETIAFAEIAYQAPNLRFLQGDARSIPLPDDSVDVVVSFETIEHFYEQQEFLSEVKRVLRVGGRLIVSSPERDVYSASGAPVNPYHVRELTREEFLALLKSNFTHTSMYAQRAMLGSTLMLEGNLGSVGPLLTFERRDTTHFEASVGVPRPLYLVAVASDSPPNDITGSLYIETSGIDGFFTRVSKAEQMARELADRLIRVTEDHNRLADEHNRLADEHNRLAEEHQQLSSDHQALRTHSEAALQRLAQVEFEREAEAAQHQVDKSQLEGDVAILRKQCEDLVASTSWRLTRPLRDLTGRGVLAAPVRRLMNNQARARRAGRRFAKVARSAVRLRTPSSLGEGLRALGSLRSRPDGLHQPHGVFEEADDARTAMLISEIRRSVPGDGTLLIATRGGEEVLDVYGRRSWRFPQAESGGYAGHDPPDGTAAIAHLEALRVRGADFLLLLEGAPIWFHRFNSFRRHVSRRYRLLSGMPDGGLLFSLREAPAQDAVPGARAFEALGLVDSEADQSLAVLDWGTDLNLAKNFPEHTIFAPPDHTRVLPYLDHSVDVVAVRNPGRTVVDESRRVARVAVVTFSDQLAESGAAVDTQIEWMPDSTASRLPSASIILTVSLDEAVAESQVAAVLDFLRAGFCCEILIPSSHVSDDARKTLDRIQSENPSARVFNADPQEVSLLAEGEVLIFVGEGVLPLPDCIPNLLSSLRRFPNAGVVGGRVVDWEGRLVEAGGVLSEDGTLQVLGTSNLEPDDPACGFVREVDWCSRSLLATWRTVFEKHAGFEGKYRSPRFQDADYCLRVRQNGYRVYYQPSSVVVLPHGHGRPASEGLDSHLFAEHWGSADSVLPAQ